MTSQLLDAPTWRAREAAHRERADAATAAYRSGRAGRVAHPGGGLLVSH